MGSRQKQSSWLISIEDKEDAANANNPYGFQIFDSMIHEESGRRVGKASFIRTMIAQQYPVSFERICREFNSRFLHSGRVTDAVRGEVRRVIAQQLLSETRPTQGLDGSTTFYWPKDKTLAIPRTAGGRKIDEISPEELEAGMQAVFDGVCGTVDKDALINETARAFGFRRTGSNIEFALETIFQRLVSQGKIKPVD